MRKKLLNQPIIFAILIISFLSYKCTNADEDPEPEIVIGDAFINTAGDIWRFDKAHSNIEWETAYLGELALLTGRFSDFNIEILFDEQNVDESSIEAEVVISSNLTGEPNRDRLGGCMPGTLGVIHNGDTLEDGSLDPEGIDPDSNIASFKSSSFTREGNEIHAIGNLTFKGVTKPVDLYFVYLGTFDNSDAQDESDLRAGFSGEFTFKAKSMFGVESDNIGDDVTIKINCEARLR